MTRYDHDKRVGGKKMISNQYDQVQSLGAKIVVGFGRLKLDKTLVGLVFIVSILLVSASTSASAQDVELTGMWEQRQEMIRVEFTLEEDLIDGNAVYSGTVKRADWAPTRVGKKVYQNLIYDGKNRWNGEEVGDNGRVRKIRIRLKNDGFLHMTTYLGGRKKVQWKQMATE